MGVRIEVGRNDLPTTCPELMKEWADDRDPTSVTAGSRYRAAWRCSTCDFPWSAVVVSRSKGAGCPRCAGRVPMPGKSFGDIHPRLVDEWDAWDTRSPFDTSPRSNFRAKWVCAFGHAWVARVADRAAGTGCRVCGGKEVLEGFNDLASHFPKIAAEWDTSNDVSPSQVFKTSGRTYTWVCPNRHTWSATVAARTSGGNSCPKCSGRKAAKGETDLATTHPHVAKEWHPDNLVEVDTVKRGSSVVEYLWKCTKGHVQKKTVRDRVEFGCTTCSRKGRTSKGERDLAAFMVSLNVGEVETSVRHLPSLREVDIAIHGLKVAMEFNGVYWHSTAIRNDTNFHLNKYLAAKNDGYLLIQIWEDDWRDDRDSVCDMIRSVVCELPPLPSAHKAKAVVSGGRVTITEERSTVFSARVRCARNVVTVSDIRTSIDCADGVALAKRCIMRSFPHARALRVVDDLCMSHERSLLKAGRIVRYLPPRATALANGKRVAISDAGGNAHRVFDAGRAVYEV